MRKYLTPRKAAFLGALTVVSLMTGYEAGAMKTAGALESPNAITKGSYEIGARSRGASNASAVDVTSATPCCNDKPTVQSKQPASANRHVYVTRRISFRHPHHAHKLANQQDFDFGYAFGGSDLD